MVNKFIISADTWHSKSSMLNNIFILHIESYYILKKL